MLGKAIRKAVLPILLASLMVGTGCRIVYGKADISLNERAENFTSDNTAASPEEQEKTTEPAAPDDALVQAPSALLMEASTGTVIYEKDSDTRRSPASITKIMTLILIFDALENGTLKMDDLVTTSAYAKSMGGSQVFLEEGETSVGVMMRTTHDAATPAGMTVTAEVEITAVDRKKVSFHIIARDERDLIGTADHDRFIVKKEAFEAKALSKLENS